LGLARALAAQRKEGRKRRSDGKGRKAGRKDRKATNLRSYQLGTAKLPTDAAKEGRKAGRKDRKATNRRGEGRKEGRAAATGKEGRKAGRTAKLPTCEATNLGRLSGCLDKGRCCRIGVGTRAGRAKVDT